MVLRFGLEIYIDLRKIYIRITHMSVSYFKEQLF